MIPSFMRPSLHCHQRGHSVAVAADVRIVWDQGALELWVKSDPQLAATMDMLAGRVLSAMKAHCPVSKVPTQDASGRWRAGGKWAKAPSGASVRYAGDFPLRPSGYLRSSCRSLREPDGSIIIGPTAPYALYVQNGTPAHPIDSHGNYPLRNRATGQVFGRHVNHPGTKAQPFITDSLAAIAGSVVDV